MTSSKRHLFILSVLLLQAATLLGQGHWRIMPMGNSITVGFHGSDPIGGYRDDLYFLMQDDGLDFNLVGTHRDGNSSSFDIDHQGTGGIRADEILLELDFSLPYATPDIILIHIGTNDISQEQNVSSTLDDIEDILDKIYAFDSGIKILLASIIPRTGSKASLTQDLNDGIKALVPAKKSEGLEVFYVPINEAFLAQNNWETLYMDDAVHPNNDGYHVLAEEWFAVLRPIMTGSGGPPDPPDPPDPPPSPGELIVVSGNNQSGPGGEILQNPLVVRLVDSNQVPVENAEVVFEIATGTGSLILADFSGFYTIEAESGQLTSPMEIISDGSASSGHYVKSDERQDGGCVLPVSIDSEDDYWFWGRVYSPSETGDSFFFSLSPSSDSMLWDTDNQYTQWYWQRFEDRGLGTVSYHLQPGEYQLSILSREPGARIDKVVVTNEPDFVPSGLSGYSNPRTDGNGEARMSWRLGTELGNQQVRVSSSQAAEDVLFDATGLTPDPISISGVVRYFGEATPVPGMSVFLNSTDEKSTDGLGLFEFNGLVEGNNYEISPSGIGFDGGEYAIISYDAAITARHAIGLEQLDSNQLLAADANGDGNVQLYDAALIARFAVGLDPLSDSVVGDWLFLPGNLTFPELGADVDTADFTAVLRGDVNGSWNPAELPKETALSPDNLLDRVHEWHGDTLVFTIPLESYEKLLSFDLDLRHNPERFTLASVDLSKVEGSFAILSNRLSNGIRIGGFSVQGSNTAHEIALKYYLKDPDMGGSITLEQFRINDNMSKKSAFHAIGASENSAITFRLFPNYPNPFREKTTLSFLLPKPGSIELQVFNLLGQEVRRETRAVSSPGLHAIDFDGRDSQGRLLLSGTYFLRIQDDQGRSLIQKLRIIR